MKGIASAMGDAVDTVTSTASNIFRLIAHSATDVTNDTVTDTAIDSIGSTLVDLVTFTEGPSNFILYVIDIDIIAYQVFKHIRGNRQDRELQPPPVPEHQGYLALVR